MHSGFAPSFFPPHPPCVLGILQQWWRWPCHQLAASSCCSSSASLMQVSLWCNSNTLVSYFLSFFSSTQIGIREEIGEHDDWEGRLFFIFYSGVCQMWARGDRRRKKNRLYLCQQIPSEAADAGWCSENASGVAVTLLPRVEYMQTFANTMAEFLEVVLASQYCVEASRWVTSTCLASLISNKYLSTDWVLLPFSPLAPFSLY